MAVSSRGVKFSMLAIILQAVFVVIMGVFGEYKDRVGSDGTSIYANFQDVNVMCFMGFGFLMTFLKNYGFGAVGLNMMICALGVQWSAIVIGFIHVDIIGGEKFQYGIIGMVESCFACATVLISFGAVLGKTSPIQILVMTIFEILFAQINKYIGVTYLHAVDVGESMYLHMFGAYFGMAVARVLYDPEVEKSEKDGSVYHADLFAMIGSLFLWMYWPSFNGGFAGAQSENAIVNTYLSLCACTVVAFAISSLVDKNGKFDMVHIQNSTLAGGVAVGACANMPMKPFGAMIIGSIAGALSVLGYRFLSPFLASKMRLHDTCGVHNLHGIPAWVAAISAAVLSAMATLSDWGDDITDIFSEVHVVNGTLSGRTPEEQGGYQMLAAVLTFGFAIVSGIITGLILKLPIWNAPKNESLFDDVDSWQLPEGTPYKEQTIDSKFDNTPM